jgi:hypothetical protein
MEAQTKENVFWNVTPSNLVEIYFEFGGSRFDGNICTYPPDKIPQFSNQPLITTSILILHHNITPHSPRVLSKNHLIMTAVV